MLKVKKLFAGATLPKRANPDDAGLDLAAYLEPLQSEPTTVIEPGERRLIPTGLALEIEPGHYGQIATRSGLAAKAGLVTIGGVIDAGYRGEVQVMLYNTSRKKHTLKNGDRIAQLIILPCCTPEIIEVNELNTSTRGANGFGSSGR